MIDIIDAKTHIQISVYDKTGNVELINVQLPESELFEYVPDPNGEYTRWCGKTRLRKKQIEKVQATSSSGKRYYKRNNLSKFRIQEFLNYSIDKDLKDKIFEFNKPRQWYCDIETEITDEFEKPETANNRVLSIALVSTDGVIICQGLRPLANKKLLEKRFSEYFSDYIDSSNTVTFNYKNYNDDEAKMLQDFFYSILPKIGCLTGWNFTGYDWPYLTNRAKKFQIDIAQSSPIKKTMQIKGASEDSFLEVPVHKFIYDYMELYKKYDRSVEVKENDTLDYVSSQVLKVKKLAYSGSLKDLYDANHDDFILYNIIDTYLVKLLNDKMQLYEIYHSLATITQSPLRRALSPIYRTESLLCLEYLQRGFKLPNEKIERTKQQYEGAYTVHPVPGFYETCAALDFASLHPSIMRQWNMSPESIVYEHELDKNELDKHSISVVKGIYFNNNSDSVLKTLILKLRSMRTDEKKKAKILIDEIESIKKQILELERSIQ